LEKYTSLNNALLVAFEDGYFPPETKGYNSIYKTLLVASIFKNWRPAYFRMTLVKIDGLDATDNAIKILKEIMKKEEQKPIVMLGGITFAGFNIIDPIAIHEKHQIPVIVVCKEKPNNERVKRALMRHFPDWEKRYHIIEKFSNTASELIELADPGRLYIRVLGMEPNQALEIIRKTQVTGGIPEPLREAKTIASVIARAYFKIIQCKKR